MIKDLIIGNRSYRRFYEDEGVDRGILLELVDLARLSPFGANKQSLKYFLSSGDRNDEIFECLGWAGYLPDWNGPEPGERPAAYIVLLNDVHISGGAGVNPGIACQSILLGAVEKGLGGCIFGSVNRDKLSKALSLPENLKIELVIALGKPKEKVVIEQIEPGGDIKYWRDADGIHHVPKRGLAEIVIE